MDTPQIKAEFDRIFNLVERTSAAVQYYRSSGQHRIAAVAEKLLAERQQSLDMLKLVLPSESYEQDSSHLLDKLTSLMQEVFSIQEASKQLQHRIDCLTNRINNI